MNTIKGLGFRLRGFAVSGQGSECRVQEMHFLIFWQSKPKLPRGHERSCLDSGSLGVLKLCFDMCFYGSRS